MTADLPMTRCGITGLAPSSVVLVTAHEYGNTRKGSAQRLDTAATRPDWAVWHTDPAVIDHTHPHFAHPRELGATLAALHAQTPPERRPHGSFDAVGDAGPPTRRLQGHVVARTGTVGVWATVAEPPAGAAEVLEVVFFTVRDDRVVVADLGRPAWAEVPRGRLPLSVLVERAAAWHDALPPAAGG